MEKYKKSKNFQLFVQYLLVLLKLCVCITLSLKDFVPDKSDEHYVRL